MHAWQHARERTVFLSTEYTRAPNLFGSFKPAKQNKPAILLFRKLLYPPDRKDKSRRRVSPKTGGRIPETPRIARIAQRLA